MANVAAANAGDKVTLANLANNGVSAATSSSAGSAVDAARSHGTTATTSADTTAHHHEESPNHIVYRKVMAAFTHSFGNCLFDDVHWFMVVTMIRLIQLINEIRNSFIC